jgi:hypothetical protein
MIRIKQLLEIDAHHHSDEALNDSIGDQFLCACNPIFARIRRKALCAGYSYSQANTELSLDYQTGPLFCLDRILKHRVIPYFANAALFRGIAERSPDYRCAPKLLLEIIRRNHVLHESCHCLADHSLQSLPMSSSGDKQAFVMRALLSEAFANAIEMLAWAYAESPTHALFLNFNSYVDFNSKKKDLIVSFMREMGDTAILKLAIVSYLCANLSAVPLSAGDAAEISAYMSEPSLNPEALSRLVLEVFTLNRDFVDLTSPAFFRLLECEAEFIDIKSRYENAGSLQLMGLLEPANALAAL